MYGEANLLIFNVGAHGFETGPSVKKFSGGEF
jgi:hypothetical protein